MISPWATNSMLDSCAFDPKYSPEDECASKLHRLCSEKDLPLFIAHSVKKELEHPNTPRWVKAEAAARIYSLKTNRTADELSRFKKIHQILTGNGRPDKYLQDAEHVFEASKYGSYFVTTDRRILDKSKKISEIVAVKILLPSEYLRLVEQYQP
ncbi:MAG TPA: hypothetical protein VFN01_11315 [Marinobacter sp.]|uniref:hypothetical protein n=1 Tax=Marinobacter sp. TaxID=50741 RepID=UPI002D7E699D|nr:hypothetical protein [Marinobacter sp.]HET8801760.1 hypothetical protein [Marinobacter sp.]